MPRVKVTVPRLPARVLSRPRLLQRLAAAEGRTTLVCGPAGYGKTVLLAEWAAARTAQVAWVSLDAGDNDDERFWLSLLAGFAACPAVPAGSRLGTLSVPTRPSHDRGFRAAVFGLVSDVVTAAGTLHLILDDVHELTDPAALHGLEVLVRDRPAGLQPVLLTRTDPPLALARMRLDGQLHEIRARDLSFSGSEAAALLRDSQVRVRADQVRMLVEQTEGWAAGLRLAALSLRDATDPDALLADLAESSQAVADYLVGEILSGWSADVVRVLRAVSICDQVSAGLAEALAGRTDAGDVLDALEQETSLVLSTGAGRLWYRVHPLLRAHLRADLRRVRPGDVARLHGRAARWWAGDGEPATALGYARHADDPRLIADLLRRHAAQLIAQGHHRAVRDALDSLGGELCTRDPVLALVTTLVALEAGDVRAADTGMALADAAWPTRPSQSVHDLRTLAHHRRVTLAAEPADLARPLVDVGPGDPDVAGLAQLDQAFVLLMAGAAQEARGLVEAVLAGARSQGRSYVTARALTTLSVIAWTDGDFRHMTALAEEADAQVPGSEWAVTFGAALTALVRSAGAMLRAEPARSLEFATAALTVVDPAGRPRPSDTDYVAARALSGAARFDLRQQEAGLAELRAARGVAAQGHADRSATALALVLEHAAATRLGHRTAAQGALRVAEDTLGPVAEVLLMRARQQRDAEPAQALGILDPVLSGTAPALMRWTAAEVWVLACQLALRADRRSTARLALEHALSFADEQDVLRPLVLAPPEVVGLLTEQIGGFGRLDPVAERVAALGARSGVAPAAVPLTGRERDVLDLLVTPLALDEIAAQLAVSASTVKTHLRGLYAKLGAGSRSAAVAAAREHGLLSLDRRPVTAGSRASTRRADPATGSVPAPRAAGHCPPVRR